MPLAKPLPSIPANHFCKIAFTLNNIPKKNLSEITTPSRNTASLLQRKIRARIFADPFSPREPSADVTRRTICEFPPASSFISRQFQKGGKTTNAISVMVQAEARLKKRQTGPSYSQKNVNCHPDHSEGSAFCLRARTLSSSFVAIRLLSPPSCNS